MLYIYKIYVCVVLADSAAGAYIYNFNSFCERLKIRGEDSVAVLTKK
jgi:hypothetical protein